MSRALSELEFYDDLVYKFRKIGGKSKFSDHSNKIFISNKRKRYNIGVIKQSACLAVNSITIDHFAYLFNCTPVCRGSDPMMAPT